MKGQMGGGEDDGKTGMQPLGGRVARAGGLHTNKETAEFGGGGSQAPTGVSDAAPEPYS